MFILRKENTIYNVVSNFTNIAELSKHRCKVTGSNFVVCNIAADRSREFPVFPLVFEQFQQRWKGRLMGIRRISRCSSIVVAFLYRYFTKWTFDNYIGQLQFHKRSFDLCISQEETGTSVWHSCVPYYI